MKEGFLGTAAPLVADLILLLEIAMGVGLLAGAWLARTKRFASHAWCQSLIVLLNMALVAPIMIPSFSVHVLPRIPGRLGKAYYALATAHAGLGTFTELAALYILLSAGTHVLPEKLRITKYKPWMGSRWRSGGACCSLASRHTRAGTYLVYFASRFTLSDSKEGD